MPQDEPLGEVPARVDASSGQGVQVGTGNIQHVHLHSEISRQDRGLDVVALGALSPHAAAAQIRRMGHDNAVVLLANALPDDGGTDLLESLLDVDEALAVSLLANINPRKAKALITRLSVSAPWLSSLPKAAKAIARRSAEMNWDQDWGIHGLVRAVQSVEGTEGYCRMCNGEMIYWSDRSGACAVSGAVAQYHAASGGTGGEFGFPLSEQLPVVASPNGTEGTAQAFEKGFIYSSAHGTYGVSQDIFNKYYSLSATGGWLGFPTAIATWEGEGLGTSQSFEGGILWVVPGNPGAVAVPVATMDMLIREDTMRALGPPLSDEAPVGDGNNERIQFFRNGAVSLRDGKREVFWSRQDFAAGSLDNTDVQRGGGAGKRTSSEAKLSPGTLFAGYRVHQFIGAGGMAAVYVAYHEGMGREVALKVFAAALAGDLEFRRRFVREARVMGRVEHPHIVPVYEAGDQHGVPFLAMRLVHGGDLRAIVSRDGALSTGRVARFISAIASALDTAHEAGLVHRDVKPANMLVDGRHGRPEHVYLSDFGLARSVGQQDVQGLSTPGQFIGTPEYAAPEQIVGGDIDGRADQYALGCVAYTLLTGSVPFPREQAIAVMYAQLYDPRPQVTVIRRDLPTAVNNVIAQAMDTRPDHRYGTCTAFADALKQALGLAEATPGGLPWAFGS